MISGTKIDWLTLSVMPSDDVDPYNFFLSLVGFFRLEEFLPLFKKGGGHGFYDYSYSYNNIVFSIPRFFESHSQGFCISFSGQGIDFYIEYMRKKDPEYSVKKILAKFLLLEVECDNLKCNISRIDLATDDITYSNKAGKALLDLDVITEAILKCEFTSPFAIKRKLKKFSVTFDNSQRAKLCGLEGDTIYLGSRRSNAYLRIYDKFVERTVNKIPIDENITHWVRFEMEFKDCNAMSVAEHMVSLSDDEFADWYSQVVNNYIRFIDVTENNISNYSRCPSKDWWADFVGTLSKTRLYHVKPVENAFDRSLRWQKKVVFPSVAALLRCITVQHYLMLVKEACLDSENAIRKQQEIENDFINADKHSPELRGLERYAQYIEDDEYRSFLLELRRARDDNVAAAVANAAKVRPSSPSYDFNYRC